jgi:DNA replication protein DnaC
MCSVCSDTYWKPVVVDGIERVVRCDCWRTDVMSRLMRDARIPPRFARATLESFERGTNDQLAAWRKASAFAENFRTSERGILFYGPHGVGKTHLAIGILRACIQQSGARGYFFETRELLRLIRDTYNRSVEETEMGILTPILEAELLVLDDLGAERTSEWVQETLGLVINTRYNTRRPTICTTNLADLKDNTDPRSLTFQLGERTRSRLLEMCQWVEIPGFDWRAGHPETPEEIARSWKPASPSPTEQSDRSSKLPNKARGQARAQFRPGRGSADLKWTGGKAGT